MAQVPTGIASLNSGSYGAHRPISAQEARAADAAASTDFSIPSLVLMEHASRGVARVVARCAEPGEPVLVLCGPGNNGGDGYGAARFLHAWGRPVRVLRLAAAAPDPTSDAGQEAAWLAADGVEIEDAHVPGRAEEALAEASGVVVDALFGLGPLRPLEAPWVGWIEAVNASSALVVAVDVPSGLDADSGVELPVCVRADVTATMVAPKQGFAAHPGAVGEVVEIDIGLPAALHGPFLL